jgi:hypothetical protein
VCQTRRHVLYLFDSVTSVVFRVASTWGFTLRIGRPSILPIRLIDTRLTGGVDGRERGKEGKKTVSQVLCGVSSYSRRMPRCPVIESVFSIICWLDGLTTDRSVDECGDASRSNARVTCGRRQSPPGQPEKGKKKTTQQSPVVPFSLIVPLDFCIHEESLLMVIQWEWRIALRLHYRVWQKREMRWREHASIVTFTVGFSFF